MELKTALSRRTVNLPNSAVAALRMQHEQQTFERVLAGDRWHECGLVFPPTVGTLLEPSNVIARLHRLLADAGLPRKRFHDLRHCSASLLLAGVALASLGILWRFKVPEPLLVVAAGAIGLIVWAVVH
jgi:integrase